MMTYHFRYLKNSEVIHMHDTYNGSVHNVMRKLSHKWLVRVFVHLNRNPLSSRKECPHVVHWRLPFSEGNDVVWKLGHFLLTEDVGKLWAERRRVQTLKWFLIDATWDDKGFPHLVIGNVPTKGGFSSSPEATVVVGISVVGLDGESELDATWAFFEENGLIAIDSNRHLHCLSHNLALKLVAISSSSSSLQIIGSTSRLSPVFVSSLEEEEDEEE